VSWWPPLFQRAFEQGDVVLFRSHRRGIALPALGPNLDADEEEGNRLTRELRHGSPPVTKRHLRLAIVRIGTQRRIAVIATSPKNRVTKTEADIPYCDVSMCNEKGAALLSLLG